MDKTLEHPHRFMKYLRQERLPHIFCPGCGNGVVLNTIFNAIELSDKSFDNISMVSGIGCSSRIPGYVKCDSLHTTHGRAIAYATGLKIANPKQDIVVVCINNDIYGMTGGQISPTSPEGSYATTAPYGSTDQPFNISAVVKAAGASFVAKYTTAQPMQVSEAIKQGLENKGFSFIEVVSQCPTYYGRKNRMKTPITMLNWFKENTITLEKAKDMSSDELKGKIITGIYVNKPRKEYVDSIEEVIKEHSDIDPDENINKAYMGD